MRNPLSLVLAGAFSVALGATATFSVAHADVKIISTVSTTGSAIGFGGFGGFRRGGQDGQQATVSPNQTYTTYFKGRKARRESADGNTIVIYDRDTDKIHRLDPKAKTYYSVSYTSVIGDNAAQNGGFMQTTTKMNLRTPAAAGAAVGGVATQSFGVDGSITMTPPAGGFGGFGGRRNGGQGGNAGAGTNVQPQGGANGNQGGRQRGGFGGISTAVTGSLSLANAAAVLPSELANAPYDRTLILPLVEQLLPANNQLLRPLVSSIARQQGIPLGAKISMQTIIQTTPPPAGGTGEAPQAPPTVPPGTVTMEVQSLDKAVTLEDSLFAVPADYKLVEAPTRGFGRGGRGGQGGQNGQDGQNGGGRRRQRNNNGGTANPTPAAL